MKREFSNEQIRTKKTHEFIPQNTDTIIERKIVRYLIQHWKGKLSLAKSFWINFVLFSILLTVQIAFYYAIIKICVISLSLPNLISTTFSYLLMLIALIIYVWQITGIWRCCLNYMKLGKKFQALIVMVIIELFVLLSIFTIISKYKITNAKIDKEKNYKYSITIVDNATKIHLVGDIKKGLSKNIKNTLKSNSNITGIIIDSYGGSGLEGYKLAKLIENNNLNTYVSSICESAGTIAFIAGKERYIDINAKIGFHYAYSVLDYPEVYNLTRWDIFPFKKTKNKTDEYQLQHISKYGITKDFIKKLRDHKSLDLLYPSTDELLNSGYIHGIKDIASISDIGVKYKNRIKANELNIKAMQLDRDGNQEEAIRLVSKVIELVDDKANLYFNRAVYNKKIKQYEPMILDLTKALELCDESDDFDIKLFIRILDFRNYAYFNLEQYDKALEDMNAIIKMDTLHATYYHKRGYVYAFLDSFSLAVKDFSKAISMDSTRAYYYFGSAVNYYFMKKYTKSLEDANNCLKCDDDDSNFIIYFVRGKTLFELQKFQEASQDLEKYISFEQDDNPPYLMLAAINYKLKNYKQAEIYFTKANSLKNNDIDVKWDEDDYEWNSTLLKSILEEWGKL